MYPPVLSFQGLDATADWWVVGRSWGKWGGKIGDLYGLVVLILSNHPQNLIFSEISEAWIITGNNTNPKTTKLRREKMTFRICAVITLGITWCSLSWKHGHEKHRKVVANILKADLLSFAKHRNASYLVEKALSYCAVEASFSHQMLPDQTKHLLSSLICQNP